MLTDVVSLQKTEFPAKKPGLTSFCRGGEWEVGGGEGGRKEGGMGRGG